MTYQNESMTDTQHDQNATLRITGTCMLHKDCVKNNKLIILLIFYSYHNNVTFSYIGSGIAVNQWSASM